MSRRVWVTGLGLIVVGVLLMVLMARPPVLPRVTPMDEVAFYLVGLVPALGLVCVSAGAVMLALATAASLTGRPLDVGRSSSLLLTGIGTVVLAEVLGVVVGGLALQGLLLVDVLLLVSHLGGTLQVFGAALLGIWLAGRS